MSLTFNSLKDRGHAIYTGSVPGQKGTHSQMPKTTAVQRATSHAHILAEDVLMLRDVPKELPTRPCFQTVWRWAQKGVRGVKLETYMVGSKTVTSKQALHRFFEATQR